MHKGSVVHVIFLYLAPGFTGGSFPFQMPPGYVLGVPLRALRVFVVNVVIPHLMPVLSLTLSARTEGSEIEGAESRFS